MTLIRQTEEYSPEHDNLFAGTQVQPVVADAVTIASGQGVLAVGTALGQITASGEYVIVDSTATDGSEVLVCILAAEVDATAAAAESAGYFTGEFNERRIVFGGTDTADTHRAAARARGIFFKDTVPA